VVLLVGRGSRRHFLDGNQEFRVSVHDEMMAQICHVSIIIGAQRVEIIQFFSNKTGAPFPWPDGTSCSFSAPGLDGSRSRTRTDDSGSW
jgi:hypothetical protein